MWLKKKMLAMISFSLLRLRSYIRKGRRKETQNEEKEKKTGREDKVEDSLSCFR